MRLAALQVLAESELRQIHDAGLSFLETCGIKTLNLHVLSPLKQCGLATRPDDAEAVGFTRSCVEDALARVPRIVEVFDRDGRAAFMLGDSTSRITAGHNAVFWVDPKTGKTQESTVADVEKFARICEQLPNIDMIGIPVMPQDVAVPETSKLYRGPVSGEPGGSRSAGCLGGRWEQRHLSTGACQSPGSWSKSARKLGRTTP